MMQSGFTYKILVHQSVVSQRNGLITTIANLIY